MNSKSNKDQSKRFIDAARDAETDDDPEAFKARLKKLVNAPTPKPVGERKAKRPTKHEVLRARHGRLRQL